MGCVRQFMFKLLFAKFIGQVGKPWPYVTKF